MNTLQVTLTITQLLIALGTLATMLYALKSFLQKPHDTLEKRVKTLEVKVNDIEDSLHQGNDKFRAQDNTNEVLIHSTLALIEFEIQYCLTENKQPTDELRQAKKDLNNFLSKKR